MIDITLVCWNCGKKYYGQINQPLQFAFELADIANQAGLFGAFDFNYGRTLVFCNEECANNQKKKDGSFRLRPKKLITQ